jgi:hypothetical protein
MPGLNMMPMPMPGLNMMPMPGMIVMSIQVESSPIDNLMSSLMSPLINNLFSPINPTMPQISSIPEKFLYLNYE